MDCLLQEGKFGIINLLLLSAGLLSHESTGLLPSRFSSHNVCKFLSCIFVTRCFLPTFDDLSRIIFTCLHFELLKSLNDFFAPMAFCIAY